MECAELAHHEDEDEDEEDERSSARDLGTGGASHVRPPTMNTFTISVDKTLDVSEQYQIEFHLRQWQELQIRNGYIIYSVPGVN